MINHPNRSKSHTYIVTAYHPGRNNALVETKVEVVAASADDAIKMTTKISNFASFTRRWQNSPVSADRDNCHVQANSAGTIGWAAHRADLDPKAAEHRSDVETARRWVAQGRNFSDLQKYGAYKSVTEQEAHQAPASNIEASNAVFAAGYSVER